MIRVAFCIVLALAGYAFADPPANPIVVQNAVDSEQPLFATLAFDPAGAGLALQTSKQVLYWDMRQHEGFHVVGRLLSNSVSPPVFSPSGKTVRWFSLYGTSFDPIESGSALPGVLFSTMFQHGAKIATVSDAVLPSDTIAVMAGISMRFTVQVWTFDLATQTAQVLLDIPLDGVSPPAEPGTMDIGTSMEADWRESDRANRLASETAMALDPSGAHLAIARGTTLAIWRLADGSHWQMKIAGADELTFDQDGTRLAVLREPDLVSVIDITKQKQQVSFHSGMPLWINHKMFPARGVKQISFGNRGASLAIAGRSYEAPNPEASLLAKQLAQLAPASPYRHAQTCVWATETGRRQRCFEACAFGAVHPTDDLLACLPDSSSAAESVTLRRASTGHVVRTIKAARAPVKALASADGGTRLIVSRSDFTSDVWSLAGVPEVTTLPGEVFGVDPQSRPLAVAYAVDEAHDPVSRCQSAWDRSARVRPGGAGHPGRARPQRAP